jgi:hypothetical protein
VPLAIESKYLILIYARKGEVRKVQEDDGRKRHAEAQHVATDRQFVSPFGRVRRKRRAQRERSGDQYPYNNKNAGIQVWL